MRLIDADKIDFKGVCGSTAIRKLFEKVIEQQPTIVAVEVREARWKGTGFGDYQCSWCGEVVSGCRDNYCRECGSKMDGGE